MKDPAMPSPDPALDVLRYERRSLRPIFAPRGVAVIGASEKVGSVGRTVLANLISQPFGGAVFPITRERPSILGIKAYRTIDAVPDPVDLAVVATPAATVPPIIAQCGAAGVRGAIILSDGFRETGPAGMALEEQALAEARKAQMRLIGPNCLGLMRPPTGLNAAFIRGSARPGNVAFLSQSGALGAAILDWSGRQKVGFSAFVSIGSMLDVNWGDLIDFFGDDPRTQSIVIYMETVGDARAFLSAAREVALTKPIIVIKAGRTAAAQKAATSHTGLLAGSDEVLDAAFRRCGVLRVNTVGALFSMAEVLAKQPRPNGPRLTIVTNAGGPGILAADAAIGGGGTLADLSQDTIAALDAVLSSRWSRSNPIDIGGDASPDQYVQAVERAIQDPNSDGLLVILTPQTLTDPTETARRLTPFAKSAGKPILASWMGAEHVTAGEAVLNEADIPTFEYPDTAAWMFDAMWRYSYNLRSLYETPTAMPDSGEHVADRQAARELIERIRATGRTILSEWESKQLLAAYRVPIVDTRVAHDIDEAVAAAETIGYPVAVKLLSETITHKSDVGGVHLNMRDAAEVRRAYAAIEHTVRERAGAGAFLGVTVQPMISWEGYETIVGSTIDPEFGPVLLFGAGGKLVEVLRDRAVALPPLNTTLARRMMEQTRIYEALKGVRGRPPADLAGLELLLVRFSQLVVEQSAIREIDINPLLVSQQRLIALDARVVLFAGDVDDAALPRPAIRPYPVQYTWPITTKGGLAATIRPIRPEDEPLMVKFHQTLSERSVYLRYFHLLSLSQRVMHERLIRICFIDYDREMALVAESSDEATGEREIMAVGRLSKLRGTNDAEFALLIHDQYQGQGLGTALLSRLIEIGRDEGMTHIVADILPDNRGMRRICEKLGFRLRYDRDEGVVKATIDLFSNPP